MFFRHYLEWCLLSCSDEEVRLIADLVRLHPHLDPSILITYFQVQKGISSARSDDTQSLKSAIIDWISPVGQTLIPPLACNIKADRSFNHDHTGFLLCPAGLNWADSECIV